MREESARAAVIVDAVCRAHEQGRAVIVIDDALQKHRKFYQQHLPTATHIIDEWNDSSKYDYCENKLTAIKNESLPIVLTDIDGARGVNFEFQVMPLVFVSMVTPDFKTL